MTGDREQGDVATGLGESVREFIAGAQKVLTEKGDGDEGLASLCEHMRRFLLEPAVMAEHDAFADRAVASAEAEGQYRDTGRRSEVLYTDASGLTLVRSRFSPTEATPVHSHGTWGVVGVYAGRDLHRSYRRRNAVMGPGYAELELIEERVLEPGDVVLIPRPPQDIHSQQGYGGEPTFELVLFGANAMVIPRLIFDLENRSAREVIPGTG